ncbi:toll/interleukin-1 receptor domain-containing protein [Erythrobacter crassostreae]|uniref:Toll/interleukin-1 receptor domain-containing protein n=1 Tax=Erythrobacter crassostreae TaxID=2828328 RepID=A0A9X1JLS1_9SPHN|nr:toll/interleukin-1 receptor domain-containing protein [Erythrobacter crassostrea]MBV7260321.1 toll/interleukin-1 receptor domain-containing protein [Erythrobacter crassostrea]
MENQSSVTSETEDEHQNYFGAFISYSHADGKAVRKLHRQIEAYRLPKGLGSVRSLNGEPGKLGKVFRDREDLSAAEDLSGAVRAALDGSQVLVVVCSPAAKSSHWVGQEIAYFREQHPTRPILAAIVDGEPKAAFPSALTTGGIEPLAADLRREGDGWKLGFLKVVAGIAGVPLDALIQRDSQRQLRRVTTITGMLAFIAIVMTAMTTIAVQARNEAQRQSRTTQEFNAYFLTEFREEMVAIGKLEIAMGFYDRILSYCEEQERIVQSLEDGQRTCARLVEITGMDYERLGDFDQARQHYLLAFRATELDLKANPDDPARILEHAISENRIGALEVRTGNYAKALDWFDSARGQITSIKQWGQTRQKWLREAAYVYANQGALFVRQDTFNQQAREMLEEAVSLNRQALKLGEDQKGFEYDLAFHLIWLAHGEFIALNRDAYNSYSQESLATSEALLAENPNDTWIAEQRMELIFRHADILNEANLDTAQIGKLLKEAISISATLAELEPKNEKWVAYRDRGLDLNKKMEDY